MENMQKDNHIFYAEEKDFNEIKKLWNICFSEFPEFSEWYFENIFQTKNTLVYKENGVICSMLQELNFEFDSTSENKKATYIYGACTHPLYRKQGLMGKLLQQSFANDKAKGIDFSILIPENEELFRFYEKFGYKPTTKIETEIVTKNENVASNDYTLKIADFSDIENINSLYLTMEKETNLILRTNDYWKTQIKMFNELGGYCFCLYNKATNNLDAYSFVWNETPLFVQEIIFKDQKSKDTLCQNILTYISNSTDIKLNVYKPAGNYTACIKSHNNEVISSYLINMLYN